MANKEKELSNYASCNMLYFSLNPKKFREIAYKHAQYLKKSRQYHVLVSRLYT